MRMMNWCVDETLEWFRSHRLTHLITLLTASCETKFEVDSPHSLIVVFETSLSAWYSNSNADIPCWKYTLVIESMKLSTCQIEFKSHELLSLLPLKGVHFFHSPGPVSPISNCTNSTTLAHPLNFCRINSTDPNCKSSSLPSKIIESVFPS